MFEFSDVELDVLLVFRDDVVQVGLCQLLDDKRLDDLVDDRC